VLLTHPRSGIYLPHISAAAPPLTPRRGDGRASARADLWTGVRRRAGVMPIIHRVDFGHPPASVGRQYHCPTSGSRQGRHPLGRGEFRLPPYVPPYKFVATYGSARLGRGPMQGAILLPFWRGHRTAEGKA
jgi:hypothetical protein